MNIRQWLWCPNCERCFSIFLTKEVGEGSIGAESTVPVIGSRQAYGEVLDKCTYDNCDGSPSDFWSWEKYRAANLSSKTGKIPEMGKVYPIIPQSCPIDLTRGEV